MHRFKAGKHTQQKRLEQRIKNLASRLGVSYSIKRLDEGAVGTLLAVSFPDRVAQGRHGQNGRFLMANGHGVVIDDSQSLADEPYIVAVDLMRTHGDSSSVFCACALDVLHLESSFPHRFKLREVVDWDEDKGRLTAVEKVELGQLVIKQRDLPSPDKEKITQALLSFVSRKALQPLNWSDKALDTLQRIRCAIEWMPEKAWPPFDQQSLIQNIEVWLEPYLTGIHSVKQLQKVDISEALLAYLGWPLNQEIDQWIPTHYALPTGTKKRIRYQEGSDPILSVRMQEMFGESESPVIADGQKTVVLELLSPAQRPLQLTKDLAGFWSGSYREVQKEMKGRYPKHVWPDDPANHIATTKTKRQLKS